MATTAIDTYIGSSTCYDRFRSLCKNFRLFGWAIRSDSAIDLPWDPELRKYCNVQIIAGKLRDKGGSRHEDPSPQSGRHNKTESILQKLVEKSETRTHGQMLVKEPDTNVRCNEWQSENARHP